MRSDMPFSDSNLNHFDIYSHVCISAQSSRRRPRRKPRDEKALVGASSGLVGLAFRRVQVRLWIRV